MNATIEKIVSLLFEDLAESEEITAIREEVLQNCQERYQDLREAGISEDEAIHAVIESLSGMEEMLSEYPRRADETVPKFQPAEQQEASEEYGDDPRTWSCDPAQSPIHEIRMEHMGSADVTVCVSQDELVHVECSEPKLTLMTGMENGVLTIALSEQKSEEVKDEIKFSLQDGFDLSSLGKMFEKLAKRFVSAVNLSGAEITLAIPASLSPAVQIGTASGSVTVKPVTLERLRIGSASGDVEAADITIMQELRVTSASGDITITGAQARHMQLSSTSGDIDACDCIIQENVKLNTTSGDIGWCEQCRSLDAASVSGDITLNGSAETIGFRTVSGDVNIRLKDSQLLSLAGSTTSGDLNVTLPADLQVDLHLSAVSSHISSHANCVPGAPVVVKLSTVSGDISVH